MSDTSTLTAPPKPKAPVKKETNLLDATHRCDHSNCSAAAYVKVFFDYGGHLLFCGHHYNRVEVAIQPFIVMDETIDERSKLKQNKLVGTENS